MIAVLGAVGKPGVRLVGYGQGSIQGWKLIGRPGVQERILSSSFFSSSTSVGGSPGAEKSRD
ncbi:hypothetical protein OIE13_28670 [Streptosporangium sp. NBC_01810]|uniref:hypothetical protein n=1 Tax=Streptosporangium sp. NBC_01810 TaxID=2975951 RepID=UPI002DDBA637|nr:hypothetical protein [Streptosporangium sp. NBC_01810]WSA24877.1 hypothetical protein OIE13_28670 [Streptosporangium sp. NBC_01810]